MKLSSLVFVALAICLSAGLSRAEDKPAQPKGKKQAKPGAALDGEAKKKIVARFDKDGDGKLNEEEKKAAQEQIKKRVGDAGGDGVAKEALLKKFDKDGDGKLSDSERAAAQEALKKRLGSDEPAGVGKKALLKKFDKDGDGKLSDEEKKAAKEAVQSRGGKGSSKPEDKKPAEDSKGPAIPAEVLKKFDKDGDGKLNEEEKKAAYEALKKRKAEQDK